MNIKEFVKHVDLYSLNEIDKVKFLTFFHQKNSGETEYSTDDVIEWFDRLHLSKPNTSRLFNNIRKSSDFIKGKQLKSFKLHATTLSNLNDTLGSNWVDNETVIHYESVLPNSLCKNTRSYLESISDQINSSFEHNIFDGCAVLMRRMIEILLILTYKNLGIENQIKYSSGDYKFLKDIISDAKQNSTLDLSRNTKSCLDTFKTLGDFSAHKLHYTCKHPYIHGNIPDFRVAVEELLFKSGLK